MLVLLKIIFQENEVRYLKPNVWSGMLRAIVMMTVVITITLALPAGHAAGKPPVISFIYIINSSVICVHFDTEANRTYTLQVTETLNPPNWHKLYAPRQLPYNGHEIFYDPIYPGEKRFYRLVAFP